jgi:hypothetical protein
MSSRRRNHPKLTPLQTKVVFFSSLALQANLGFIRPKNVGPRADENVDITVTLHAGEFTTIQVDCGLPANHVRDVPINVALQLTHELSRRRRARR